MLADRKPAAGVADRGEDECLLPLRRERLCGRGLERQRPGVVGRERQRLGDLPHRHDRVVRLVIGRTKMFRRRGEQLVDGSRQVFGGLGGFPFGDRVGDALREQHGSRVLGVQARARISTRRAP